jgi:ABC-type polysaccharide/polyol phosphate transport system ATPase subunit
MDNNIAISVNNLNKTFCIPHEKISTMRGAFVSVFKKKTYEKFKALDDVSFEVKKGEFFGIIGRNGSGKSTLLKILAGIYQSDKGKIQINGRISPFLELGIGFNPELSGSDNIYLNASILGLSKKQIDEKFDDIVRFSELKRFIDQKVKNYSSGMQVRLAFSVAIHANRDILLMDEVLAVGDANFQHKCLSEFNKYKHLGKTVVLVTHDILAVQKYCDRAMLLRNGKITNIGKPEKVCNEYIYQNMSDEDRRIIEEEKIRKEEEVMTRKKKEEMDRKKSEETIKISIEQEQNKIEREIIEEEKRKKEAEMNKEIKISKVEFFNKDNERKNVFKTGDDILLKIFLQVRKKNRSYHFGVGLYNLQGAYITGVHTLLDNIDTKKYLNQGYIHMIFPKNILKTDAYYVRVGIVGDVLGRYYDFLDRSSTFRIFSSDKNQEGIVRLDYKWL